MKPTFKPSIAVKLTIAETQKLVTDLLSAINRAEPDDGYCHGAELTVTVYDGDNAGVTAHCYTWPNGENQRKATRS